MRCGEMIALEWTDVDLANRQLCVQRSDWNGEVTSPRAEASLHAIDETTGDCAERASTPAEHAGALSGRWPAAHAADRSRNGEAAPPSARTCGRSVHILRHTFCSHLAMRGAPARAIQELAGHGDLSMTQRYMHLSPAALDAAIRLLDAPSTCLTAWQHVETGTSVRKIVIN